MAATLLVDSQIPLAGNRPLVRVSCLECGGGVLLDLPDETVRQVSEGLADTHVCGEWPA
jgi:hypothetical protein